MAEPQRRHQDAERLAYEQHLDAYVDELLATGPGPGDPVLRWRRWWHEHVPDGRLLWTGGDLRAAGLTRSAARHAVRTGRWHQAGRDRLVRLDLTSADRQLSERRRHAVAAAAAATAGGGRVVSGRSAAVVHGLPVLRTPARPEVTAAGSRPGARGPVAVRPAGVAAGERERWFEADLTTVPRTLVDLGRHRSVDALMAADAALRARLATRLEIEDALARATGWPGVCRARAVLALASPLAESPLESLVRWVLHAAGVPAPELQVWVGRYRVDMLWRARRLALEVDGIEKYTREQWYREKQREQALRRAGLTVERVTWDDLLHHRGAMLARLRILLAA